MGLFKRVAEKVAYEKESHRMGKEHVAKVRKDSPELYVKGYWRKTPEQARAEVRQAKKGR
ncbi:hypothetical protein CO540_13410 [Micromonospora sp. WMMA2032]|uniref:hypothetical protein n=1 Tax=Micromonospora sp. WMMA2032 TaxID=2039870 RepID=UPI000C05C4F5|nr:hypothetical protein [Micromonospora sp. WMMA2032]ATO14705.1 hypothetical protein CO540_13410 [Micromonospora sp. WMMA2032]